MKALFITLAVLAALLLLLIFAYLYLIMPSFKRKKQMMKFASHKYAHRGLHSSSVAENSMTAFRLAVERGYGIELDIRLTKDEKLVVFHDNTLERVTGANGRVDEFDYDELSSLKLSGTEDGIPLFSEVLSLVDGKVPLLIELKENAGSLLVTEKALELLSSYKGEYIIESFNPLSLKLIKEKRPDVLRGMLSMDYMKEERFRKPLYFALKNLLTNFMCRPDFISYDHKSYKNISLRLCRFLFGAVTVAWTITSPEEEALAYKHKFDTVIFENYTHGEKQ